VAAKGDVDSYWTRNTDSQLACSKSQLTVSKDGSEVDFAQYFFIDRQLYNSSEFRAVYLNIKTVFLILY